MKFAEVKIQVPETFEEFVREIRNQKWFQSQLKKLNFTLEYLDLIISKTYNKEKRENLLRSRNAVNRDIFACKHQIAKLEVSMCFFEMERTQF